MSYPVTYYCPRCGALVELEREGYLSDKAITPYPFEGWTYADPDEAFEDGAADGVRFVCGVSDAPGLSWRPASDGSPAASEETGADGTHGTDDGVGCGEPFYLSFVRYEGGEEVDPRRPSERVELGASGGPRGSTGPRGPGPGSGFGSDDR